MPAFKKWGIAFLALFWAAVLLIGGLVAVIDPYFHYHKPLTGLSYNIYYQRYQNDGIVKHFDYDAVITGNSMTENFKTSQCDALFGTNSIKVPFSGASLKELDQNLRIALAHNPDIRMVIMGLDYGSFVQDKDYMAYDDADYPDFLYDDKLLNDVKYLLNRNMLSASLDVLSRTRSGLPTTSFDEYSTWDPATVYGQDAVFSSYERHWDNPEITSLTPERQETLRGNISQNLLETAKANPQVEFYFYFPPYSILFWDKQERMGVLEMQLAAEKQTIEMLLTQENIHLFSFLDAFDLIGDFSHYKDYIHHDPQINEWILHCMAEGKHQLTADNYMEYCQRLRDYVTTYDYDSLFDTMKG